MSENSQEGYNTNGVNMHKRNYKRCTTNGPERFKKGTEKFVSRGRNQDHKNYISYEIRRVLQGVK